ncbi:uncharacterized protein LOC110712512 [Chenopodium quinoa]|uniref:uncharacterized protein LOC110712512 n=1 Tax=Chenopodium quinoa TaxID=63459 RepID=UPI000B76E7E9|nr:uncharacterized protein LOC110712512 [Chenopodium quinoa]
MDNPLSDKIAARKRRGRPLGAKDLKPRKSKRVEMRNKKSEKSSNKVDQIQNDENIISPQDESKESDGTSEGERENEIVDNHEISINYVHTRKHWDRVKIYVNDVFAYSIATEITTDVEDTEPSFVDECRRRSDWPKREVFSPAVQTPKGVKLVGYRWVFIRKRNEKEEIVRYKARLVAQGFSQRSGIDYEEIYSPVVDATTLRFLISVSACKGLQMCLMDVVTAYLYGSFDTDIYMRVLEGLELPQH